MLGKETRLPRLADTLIRVCKACHSSSRMNHEAVFEAGNTRAGMREAVSTAVPGRRASRGQTCLNISFAGILHQPTRDVEPRSLSKGFYETLARLERVSVSNYTQMFDLLDQNCNPY